MNQQPGSVSNLSADRNGEALESRCEAASFEDLRELAGRYNERLDFRGAAEVYRNAVDQDPDNADALLGLSSALYHQGDMEAALELATQAGTIRPGDPNVHNHIFPCLLALNRPREAWIKYEDRFSLPRTDTPREPPPVPKWQGQPLEDRTLLIWREEGVGDEMQFSSCLRDAVERWPCRIVYECSPRLEALNRRSFPDIEVRAEDPGGGDFDGIDYHLPVGSLPLYFRNDLKDFDDAEPYLVPDAERVAFWQNRFAKLGGGPKIGVGLRSLNNSWSKRPMHSKLADWKPISDVEGLVFVNLQCDDVSAEIAAAQRDMGMVVHTFGDIDLMNDLDDVAALLTALDAVVSARCWVNLFAGAVGTKVYSFTAHPNPWMLGQAYNPWVPQTEVFYRQYGADWSVPMAQIAARMKDRFGL